jgi:hypothetical protein
MNSFRQFTNPSKRRGERKWQIMRKWHRATGGAICVLFLVNSVFARDHKEHPYRHSDVDMAVSLSAGTVRTPEFPVGGQWYDIMVQVEEPLPFMQMKCMMGVVGGPLDSKNCSSDDPLLKADWAVLDGGQVVDKGTIPNRCACKFENKYIYKFLGSFSGEAGKKYVVEVTFTKDGTPLNVANPHLIVIQHKLN